MNEYTFETKHFYMYPTPTDNATFVLKLLNTLKWLLYIGKYKKEKIS